ncbi:PEP-CTERM sorting domain-containing protein, partial [Akkermansiaceae bacterium]|nr:PEP-CTERM sorting domain-containing protein [Akkermansiaceae bacterium]
SGDYLIGTFTADAASQTFRMGATRAGNYVDGQAYDNSNGGQAQINALQVRDLGVVPEPSSTALLGLGGLALILRRRK